jgi:hypothetical protein
VIAQTLAKHLGENSPIVKLLSPADGNVLLAAFSETLDGALEAQREVLLEQFSLDHEGSALHRLSTMLIASRAEVRSTLDTFKTRREEAARSPRHGVTFEEQSSRPRPTNATRSRTRSPSWPTRARTATPRSASSSSTEPAPPTAWTASTV